MHGYTQLLRVYNSGLLSSKLWVEIIRSRNESHKTKIKVVAMNKQIIKVGGNKTNLF